MIGAPSGRCTIGRLARVEERLLIRLGGIESWHVPSRITLGLRWLPVGLVAVAVR